MKVLVVQWQKEKMCTWYLLINFVQKARHVTNCLIWTKIHRRVVELQSFRGSSFENL